MESKKAEVGNQGTVNLSVNAIEKVNGLEKKVDLVVETLKNVVSNLDQFRKESESRWQKLI